MPTATYRQGDLVWLKDPIQMPDGDELDHPVLIISSNQANSYEAFYTGVMMSATSHKDRYSFPVSDDMFESPLRKPGCQIRTYVLISFLEEDISRFANRMKSIHLKGLINHVKDYLLVVD